MASKLLSKFDLNRFQWFSFSGPFNRRMVKFSKYCTVCTRTSPYKKRSYKIPVNAETANLLHTKEVIRPVGQGVYLLNHVMCGW